MAKQGKRTTGNLARLEQRLVKVHAEREGIIQQIKTALEQLTLGSYAPMAGFSQVYSAGKKGGKKTTGRRPGFKMSAAARQKISLAATKRWAAKKAAQKK